MRLKDAKMHSIVRVRKILANGELRRRFLDLGLIEGTDIEVLYKSALGDPIAYLIRGAIIALREEEGDKIQVISNN